MTPTFLSAIWFLLTHPTLGPVVTLLCMCVGSGKPLPRILRQPFMPPLQRQPDGPEQFISSAMEIIGLYKGD